LKGYSVALISIGSVLVILAILFLIAYLKLMKFIATPPENNPREFHKRIESLEEKGDKKRIVFIGDSLTHANISTSYIEMLKDCLGEKDYYYINAGINGELAYNVLQRLHDVIACKPDIITILIGTNDALIELDLSESRQNKHRSKLPQKPTIDWYAENLERIVSKLKEQTQGRIALSSIPPIGEKLTGKCYEKVKDYTRVIKEIADKKELVYLPVFEKLVEEIKKKQKSSKYECAEPLMIKAISKFFFFGASLDEISESNNFIVLTDQIHLNTKGATIIAELMKDFIARKKPN
jgi:lysophospholipase L1-like esterase